MQIDLSEIIIRDGMTKRLAVDQTRVEDPNLVFVDPIVGEGVFTNAIEILTIKGETDTTVQLECARCLKPVETPLHVTLGEAFPIEDIREPGAKKENDLDTDFVVRSVIYLERGRPILDLDELLRQSILLELPPRVVCDEECPGLCPGCGVDLSQEACRCGAKPNAGPFAALGALLKDGGSQH